MDFNIRFICRPHIFQLKKVNFLEIQTRFLGTETQQKFDYCQNLCLLYLGNKITNPVQ